MTTVTATGQFVARFAKLLVIDHEGDVLWPGCFGPAKEVAVSPWNHSSMTSLNRTPVMPVGRATINEEGGWAVARGTFFLDTQGGREVYATVKGLGPLTEWSFGYFVTKSAPSQIYFGARDIHELFCFEISPVLLGAGIDTGTVSMASRDVQAELAVMHARLLGVAV